MALIDVSLLGPATVVMARAISFLYPWGLPAHVGLAWPFVICRGALCVFLVSAVALGRLT
jgi:hypothetical protein